MPPEPYPLVHVTQVIIAGAGGAAHLPGMVAALTPLPVVGVPVKPAGAHTDGMDALLSIVQVGTRRRALIGFKAWSSRDWGLRRRCCSGGSAMHWWNSGYSF